MADAMSGGKKSVTGSVRHNAALQANVHIQFHSFIEWAA